MAYLIPSSIFKNVFAHELREYLKPHITEIYDFTTKRLFTKDINENPDIRLTSSIIMIIEKNSNKRAITYHDVVKNTKTKIQKKELKTKWIFSIQEDEEENIQKIRFGDLYKISNTIATLYNKAYVINEKQEVDEDEKYIYLNEGQKIEKDILKETASPRNLSRQTREKIIYPYKINNGNIEKYSKEEFENKFPNACLYLKNNIEKLNNRKSDENSKWFEYGRSQAIDSILKDKLLISTVITKEVHVYPIEKGAIPYSGIYIQAKGNQDLEQARQILESQEFFEYIEKIGIHASGESYRITSKDISNYEF